MKSIVEGTQEKRQLLQVVGKLFSNCSQLLKHFVPTAC